MQKQAFDAIRYGVVDDDVAVCPAQDSAGPGRSSGQPDGGTMDSEFPVGVWTSTTGEAGSTVTNARSTGLQRAFAARCWRDQSIPLPVITLRLDSAQTPGNDVVLTPNQMMGTLTMIRVGILAGLLVPQVLCAASEFDNLAKDVPPGANVILLIDVEKTLATEMAKTNGWASPEKVATRPAYLPPEADKVVVASQVDPPNGFKQSWESAVVGLKESLPMRLIAKAEGGYVDAINGKECAWVPSDAYFVQINENTLGLLHPANKQAASRWIDEQKSSRTGVSSYLQSAIDEVATGPQIVLALDAKDALSAHQLHQRLSESKVVAQAKLDVDSMVGLFSSLRGITLGITISDNAQARAEIEFGQTITFDAAVGKAFVLAALTNLQAEIPGVDAWTYSIRENSIIAEGELPLPGLRRILSTLEIPTTKFSSLKGEDTESVGSAEDILTKSLTYFKSISGLIKDLERQSKSSSGDNYWFDRYAKRIDRLPILHVDPDLLDFGQKTSETLRVMSGARKSANLSTGVAKANIGASTDNDEGSNGYVGYGRNGYRGGYRRSGYASVSGRASAQQRSINAADRRFQATATTKKIEGFRLIDEATYELRRTMTERYNSEF